jgi:hypothetical protein
MCSCLPLLIWQYAMVWVAVHVEGSSILYWSHTGTSCSEHLLAHSCVNYQVNFLKSVRFFTCMESIRAVNFSIKKEVFGNKHPKMVLKLPTPCITFILAIFSTYTFQHTRRHHQGVTIHLFDLLACHMDISTVQSCTENAALQGWAHIKVYKQPQSHQDMLV